jgi:hypothetical protein
MYSAGNKCVKNLIDTGVTLTELRQGAHLAEIRDAMMRAFRHSCDPSSGHDAVNQIRNFLEELNETIEEWGRFMTIELPPARVRR